MYVFCAAFSTTQAMTDWSCVLYSLIYTSIFTIVVGVLDKDLSHKTLLQHPKLYGAGLRQESYSLRLFWIAMLDTLWQSLAPFYIPVCTYMGTAIDSWSFGNLWTIAV
uniref:P-type ATPase C-terminal domain-containing protein n=1 Tax=Opuntia streptacantha TaxID=393608 RepID=A0A7C9ATS1_OPUST